MIESWINAQVTNSNRARTLSIYRFVDLGSVTLAQYIIPIAGIGGPVVFSLIAMALSLSLVPISLADKSNPAPPKQIPFNLFAVWRISPLAVVGCVAVGLSMAAFRNIGPIYAEQIGLSVTAIATFMSAGIIGGVVLQYPLGVYSDRYDRRIIILATTAGSVIVGLFLAFFAGTDEWSNIIGVFIFGAFALPLYSLSSAHGNDHAKEGEHAMVSAGLLFFWSVGATVGPLLASVLIDQFGPKALFSYTAAIQIVFIAYTIYRLQVREGVPVEERNWRFRSLLRTSAYFQKLAAPPPPKTMGRSQIRPRKTIHEPSKAGFVLTCARQRESKTDNFHEWPFAMIETTAALAEACTELAKSEFITIDTEFLRETTFWPELCLVQMASPTLEVLVDPLAKVSISPRCSN